MDDKIAVKQSEWRDTPDYCPSCDRDLERDLDEGVLSGQKIGYRDADSNYGEYTEAYCLSCDFPLQRHYENVEVNQQEDPLVAPEPWVYSAEILEQDTTLKHREAQVKALKKQGCTHAEIADTLGISESTVGEYSRRISNRVEESIRTLEEIGVEADPLRHIEGQFDGWGVTSHNQWSCANCNTILESGDTAKVGAEYVRESWQAIDAVCEECDWESIPRVVEEAQVAPHPYAIVEGTLAEPGDTSLTGSSAPGTSPALTLKDPAVRQLLNG